MKLFKIIFFLSIFAMQLIGQTNTDSVQLSEVVVTGSKVSISRKVVPLSVSQISQKEIEQTGQINILPTLNTYVPGVFVTGRNILGFGVAAGGSGAITMRGIGGSPNSEVLVLIDGHPQYQGIFGHPLPDAYIASDVEKVEIIRGPGSLLYGSNAMGGVINIITRKNTKEGLSGNIGAAYGTFNTQKYYGTLGLKKNKFNIFASVNHDRTDGIRKNTDFEITNAYAKAGLLINDHFNFTADVSVAKFNANDNGSIYLAVPKPFNINILRGKTALSLDNKFGNFEGSLKVYHNFGEHKLSDGFQSTDRNSGAVLYQSYKFSSNTLLTAGLDIKEFGGIVNQTKNKDTLLIVNEAAVYVYAQQNLFNKLTMSAGFRLENNSKYGNEIIPLGGISYYPTERTTIKLSVSKGFRSPTIMEMFLYAPNPDLLPERMMNYELSWLQSLFNNKINLEITAYKVKGNNLIHVVGQGPSVKRQNIGTFDNQGVEFSAKYALHKNIFLHANYSYINLSKAVVAAPRQQLNVSANLAYKIWKLNISTQYIEKLYTLIPINAAIPPTIQADYFLLNARLACEPSKNLQVYVMGNNLLNQTYEINYGYPMTGINIHTGISYKF